jgi:hypothetical protein
MKNTFRTISAGLIVGLLSSLVLPVIVSAQTTPTYKRIILRPYVGKVTLQRSFQPDITASATFSSGCNTTYIPNNTSWSSLVANVTNDLSTGFAPNFIITKVPASAVAAPGECKVLISNASIYNTYVQGTDQYKFITKGKIVLDTAYANDSGPVLNTNFNGGGGGVNPNTPGVTAVYDHDFNQKVINPTTGNTNPQQVERNAADYNFKKYEAKAIDRVNNPVDISGGGMAAGINREANAEGWDVKPAKGL